MTTVYLANYKGTKSLFEKIVKFWAPPYTHDELVIDGVSYSSSLRDGGVRKKKDIDFNSGNWDLIPVPWADVDHIFKLYKETRHLKYDIFGLIGSHLFNRALHDKKKYFCSEWCATGLKLNSSVFSPSSLAATVQNINKIWYNHARQVESQN
jgi:hypothetical protein